jgi:hypothetical protein
VLLAEDGTPKITDFGLAKKLDEASQTATGAVMGTPSYMAPEQAGGRTGAIGPAADVYALGAILYECLTGRPPFKAATAFDTIMQVVSEPPVSPLLLQRKLPGDLVTICLKCLEKDPARRYASAEALAEDLERWQKGEPIRARAAGLSQRVLVWARRNPGLAVMRGLVGAGLLIPSLFSGLPGIFQLGLGVSVVSAVMQARLKVALAVLVVSAVAVMLVASEPSTGINVIRQWAESGENDPEGTELRQAVEWLNRVQLLVWIPIMVSLSAAVLARRRSRLTLLSVLLLGGLSLGSWLVGPEGAEGLPSDDIKLKWFLIGPMGGLFLGIVCRVVRRYLGGTAIDVACGGAVGTFVGTWIGWVVAAMVTSADVISMLIVAFPFLPLGAFGSAALGAVASNKPVKRERPGLL